MALEGTLHDMPLADLFEVFRAGRRSGRLTVSRPGERGLIFVGGGQLRDAVLMTDPEGSRIAYAEDAVIRILGWSAADFVFEHDPVANERPRRIVRDIDWLLDAAAKNALPRVSLDSVLQPAKLAPDSAGLLTLRVAEWQLLGALWPQRTLGMACVELELPAAEVLALAQALVERGMLTIAETFELARAVPHRAEPAQPVKAPPHLTLVTRPKAMAPAVEPPKSHLLKAIIRRVRAL